MPAFTPNRNYPYPVPTDTTDIPGDLQRLAEAVDADVQALQAIVGPRPMVRMRGFTPVIHAGAASTFGELYMEQIDFNIGGAAGPLTNGRLDLLLPGAWLIVGTFTYAPPGGANVVSIGVNLINALSNSEIGRVNTHLFPAVPEMQRQMDTSGMTFVVASDSFFLRSEVRRSAGGSSVTFLDRTLLAMRMTES